MARVRRSEENSIGINWSLKYRNKISELEHKLEDTEKHNRELIRKVKKYFSPLSFPLFLLFSVFCLRRGKNERTEKTATNRLRKEYVRLCRVFERSSQVTTISSPSQNSRY